MMPERKQFHDLFTFEHKRPSNAISSVETIYFNCVYEGKHYDYIILFHNHMDVKGRPPNDLSHGNGFYMTCCNDGPPKEQLIVDLTVSKAK